MGIVEGDESMDVETERENEQCRDQEKLEHRERNEWG